ncbi:MAG: ribonuclease HII [Parvularculaceae bacterium]|jgi:ribonuclease HII|nr:ribonuclease HII [Parvularculaceae bacterium]
MAETATFEIENSFKGVVAGIDEAGRGPWAGPVVAAAVILDPSTAPAGLRDSKTLSEKKRKELAAALWTSAQIGVGVASVEEIDRLNILQASLLAMTRAAANLPARPAVAIIDGAVKPKLRCRAYTVIGGDAKSLSIAAASIIAKTTRDRMMKELAREFPQYAWDRNKGYGVEEHRDALLRFGVTPHHRRSFAPIHNMLCADAFQLPLPVNLS